MKQAFKKLLQQRQEPKKLKYTVMHDNVPAAKQMVKGVHYKIVCSSPKLPCPLTSAEVLALKDYQVDELLELIRFRSLSKKLEKNRTHYFEWIRHLEKNK